MFANKRNRVYPAGRIYPRKAFNLICLSLRLFGRCKC